MLKFVSVVIMVTILIMQKNQLVLGSGMSPIVVTPLGMIEGHWLRSVNNRTFAAFEGIPYAIPPTGDRRFKEAQPATKWVGTWQAKYHYSCLQYSHFTQPGHDFVRGDEDCLYLNVYTPPIDSSVPLNVIVFIHGGAFMYGSGASYGPKYLMDRDVVYVTINYRVGPLGFLCTEDSIVPGNNGLKDQLLALKWIKENIEYFSGNPKSITLTGMSAGGASVHLHYLSPLSTDLFHRGIAQSGTALNPWVLMENPLLKAKQLASHVGCCLNQTKEMVDCMKQRTGRQIVDAVKYFLPWLYNPFSPFGVVIDRWSNNPIIPEHPFVLLKNKRVQDLPIIFSNVESEGLYPAADFIADTKYLDEIEINWDELIPYILDFNNTVSFEKKREVTKSIKAFYFGETKVTPSTFPKLVKMITDRLYVVDIERAAKLHASVTSAPVYYYYFSYRGAHSISEFRSHSNKNYGVSHADDTVYVISMHIDVRSTDNDIQMSELLLNMWTNYTVNSNPKLGSMVWTPVLKNDSAPIAFAHIKAPDNIEMETSLDLGNRPFWDSLKFQENQNL